MSKINSSYPSAVAHFVLTLVSVWALCHSSDFVLATLGFTLYMINGLLGVLTFGVVGSERVGLLMYKLYSRLSVWSLTLGLPLFVTQLYIKDGFPNYLSLPHFLLPVTYALTTANFQRCHSFLLHALNAVYLISLTYISVMKRYYYGLSSAVSFLIAYHVIGNTGTVQNTPSRDLINYALSFSVYFIIQTLRGY